MGHNETSVRLTPPGGRLCAKNVSLDLDERISVLAERASAESQSHRLSNVLGFTVGS
jgi:hypothetical protein